MKIRWTADAIGDRAAVLDNIAFESPKGATRVDETLMAAVRRLEDFPRMGRPGMIEGTRELVILQNYRLVYVVEPDAIRIISLVHAARKWPPDDETR